MQVILRQDVEKVGLRGEVVEVAAGYARNYLLPRRLAEPATPGRVREIEKVEANRARHEAQSFEQAQELARTLEADELRFDVQAGPTGTLFGSVTATDRRRRGSRRRRRRIPRSRTRPRASRPPRRSLRKCLQTTSTAPPTRST